jgi:hypothetical protein
MSTSPRLEWSGFQHTRRSTHRMCGCRYDSPGVRPGQYACGLPVRASKPSRCPNLGAPALEISIMLTKEHERNAIIIISVELELIAECTLLPTDVLRFCVCPRECGTGGIVVVAVDKEVH